MCLLLQMFHKLKLRKYALNVNGHCETYTIVLVLRILTTCTSQCSLHSIKAVILLWYNVFGHYKCIIFYQVLNICVTSQRWCFCPETCSRKYRIITYILCLSIFGFIVRNNSHYMELIMSKMNVSKGKHFNALEIEGNYAI
jgi:hypothetical protein